MRIPALILLLAFSVPAFAADDQPKKELWKVCMELQSTIGQHNQRWAIAKSHYNAAEKGVRKSKYASNRRYWSSEMAKTRPVLAKESAAMEVLSKNGREAGCKGGSFEERKKSKN